MALHVTLRDGTPAMIWPLLPSDRRVVSEVFRLLSPESRIRRFLTALPTLNERLLSALVDQVDGVDHVALVLAVLPDDAPDQIVGVGRMARDPYDPRAADLAVTVLDPWQGRGVASRLLEALKRDGLQDVDRIVTEVAEDNRASLAMLRRLGSMELERTGNGTVEVSVDLRGEPVGSAEPTPAPDGMALAS